MKKRRTPQQLPDLRRVDNAAFDLETCDRGLQDGRGSSWAWGDGHIAGVSVSYWAESEVRRHYFPLRHPDSDNYDPAQVYAWLKDLFASDARIITQNGGYDYGWLRTEAGIRMPPSDRLEEIGALATIVDENLSNYRLDALCQHYGLPGKDEALLRQAAEAMGFGPKQIKENIWQIPARYVAPYAEADAAALLPLREKLDPVLDREGTRDAYRLECDLLPMVLEMRLRGVRIDQDAAEQARDLILRKRDAALADLSEQYGARVGMDEINRSKWKAKACDQHGIEYPRTEKDNPSFSTKKSGWMAEHDHWLPRLIASASKYEAAGTKFLEGHILDHVVNGRIHAEVHPFRAEGGGTRSSRFSYSNPPLQQIPSRDKELGPLIRKCFLSEESERWAKADASQQEFRLVVHHAVQRGMPGAREAAEQYRNDAGTDFHTMVGEMTGLDRDSAKAVNFARLYGAGVRKFAEMIGKPLSEAQVIYAQYDDRLPFVKRLSRDVQDEAEHLGYTALYDGARRHWSLWAPRWLAAGDGGPCSLEEAQQRTHDTEHPWFYQKLQRFGTYTALNALIQGSAARHTKLWMRAVWREGIVPLLQMHDALECSVSSREQGELVARLGEEAVQLEVPMKVDLKFGKSWGDATHEWEGAKMSAAESIAKTLGGRKSGKGWIAQCPLHDDSTPSLSISTGKNGKVLVHCFAGCDQRKVYLAVLRKRGVLGTPRNAPVVAVEDDALRSRDWALKIWHATQPAKGTQVEAYLAARGITLPVPDALRFHGNLQHPTGRGWPAMVALVMNGVDATPLAIHRTFLARDGNGKAPIDPQKMMLGPCRGGVVPLANANPSRPLMIGEGIETCLSAMQATGHPAWAALSTGGLRALDLPAGVRDVIVLADGDVPGEAAARAAALRWKRQGRRVRIARPPQGQDFNDMLKAGAG